MAFGDPSYETVFRFFHILSGITWIGLLYFFNLVNLPLLRFKMKNPVDVDMAAKATPHLTLKSLWWFRWGAMFTLIFGLLLIEVKRQQFGSLGAYFFQNGPAGYLIFIAVAVALTMWFNVWFLIWPNQKVILSNNLRIATGTLADDEKKALEADNAPRVKTAVTASRYNTWASIPMLFGMVFGAHGGYAADWGELLGPIIVLAAVVLIMVVASRQKAS